MSNDNSRWARLKECYPEAADETIQRYLDLREEGYPQYQALIMSGLADPSESGEAE